MSMMQALNLEDMEKVTGGVEEDPIMSYTVRWYDAAGNEYSYTVNNRPAELPDPIISQTVTWEDGAGNTYSNTYPN